MKRLVRIVTEILLVLPVISVMADDRDGDIVLSSGGKTSYVIVTDKGASSNVRFAAWDLARILHQVTGANFHQCEPGSPVMDGVRCIRVGSAAGQERAGAGSVLGLGREGSLLQSCANGDILLLGKDDYGITGAVYDFLEKCLGCHWYTGYGDACIPKREELVVRPFAYLVNPPFESRWLLTVGNVTCAVPDGDLVLFRNGQNMTGHPTYRNVSLPVGCSGISCSIVLRGDYCHSLFNVIPPHGAQEYFARHPEWFSLVRGKGDEPGRRVDNRQLCFSNRELRMEYTKNLLTQVEVSGAKDGVFGISAMDRPGSFCDCDGCRALVKKYGTPGAPLFDYLAEVGKEVQARYPKILLSTLAYRKEQSQRPPNDAFPRFPSNVLVVFAPIDDDFSKDLSHAHNRGTFKDLANWRKVAEHVWAWYYPIPFDGINPSACIRRSARDVRLMQSVGVTGTGFEHRVGRDCGANFYDLHAWVLMKLFREPNQDVEALVRTFCADYYGGAAEDVWRYWDSLEQMRELYPAYVAWDGSFPLAYTPEKVAEWMRMMDAAEMKVAHDPVLLQHVRETRLGLDTLVLKRYPNLRRSASFPPVSADTLRDRLTNTYHQCASRRGRGSGKEDIDRVQTLYMLAGADDLKPAEFAGVRDEDIRQSFAFYPGSGCKRRPDKDSCIGQACWDDAEGKSGRSDFKCDFHDIFGQKHPLTTVIPNADMVEGKFHFYKLGKIRLTPSCYVCLGSNWHVLSSLSDLYMPGTDEEWELYVAMKFEGPQYFQHSQLTQSRAVFDRTILIRVPRK